MKESVWYYAPMNEILVRDAPYRVSRGCQGSNTIKFGGKEISVPDWGDLFSWKIEPRKWKSHVKKKYLIRLGNL